MNKPDASRQALDNLRIANVDLRRRPTMSVDKACYDLAARFLRDCVKRSDQEAAEIDRKELAEDIQRTIEDFIANRFSDQV